MVELVTTVATVASLDAKVQVPATAPFEVVSVGGVGAKSAFPVVLVTFAHDPKVGVVAETVRVAVFEIGVTIRLVLSLGVKVAVIVEVPAPTGCTELPTMVATAVLLEL
jgi:hypothetical protein